MRGRDLQQQLGAQFVFGDIVADGKNGIAFHYLGPAGGDLTVNQAVIDA